MAAQKRQVEVGGRMLTLTNLDKVLYPGNGFTKAHVIDYYIKVSRCLLPHFHRRPVTLNRFPDGVGGKGFYEKDAPSYLPEWAHTTEVPRQAGGEPIRYICIDDVATLAWCANVASLELHPFLHHAGALDRPASIVFDLDPGPGANLVTCAEVAFLLRSLLASNGLQCFPKVSGSKGLQVFAPLNTTVTYADSRAAAQSVAQLLAREKPSLIVAEMTKRLREGKVFIDWSQNSDFKTTIGVYSLRAKSDTPFVSAPVSWEEVEAMQQKADPAMLQFDPDAVLRRIDRLGDLFEPLLELKQKLPKSIEARQEKVPTARKAPAAARKRARRTTATSESLQELPKAKAEFIEPMLLLRTDSLPEGKEWLYEIKLDGYRALAIQSGGAVDLRSRNDNSFTSRYPQIAAALDGLPPDTVVDGEVVAFDADGRPSFNLLQNYGSSRAPLAYYAFDLLVLKGRSLMGEPLSRRRELLIAEALSKLDEPIRYSPELEAPLSDLIRSVKAQGLEGLIAKRRDSVYEAGERSGAWRKMRLNQGQEFVIAGYTPSAKNFDALIIGYYRDGQLTYVARTRNGFTPFSRAELFPKLKKLEIGECPFANLPENTAGRWGQGLTAAKMKECRWLKPVTVGQFEFVEWTPDDHLRHSKFVGLRPDKSPSEVRRE